MARKYSIQLMDRVTGKQITASGGTCMVVSNGGADKVSLQDSAGASATNPTSLTNGLIEFYTADTVLIVDLYGMAPGGQFFVAQDVEPGAVAEIWIDRNQRNQCMVIPFHTDDQTTDSETDTGFDTDTDKIFLPFAGVDVKTVDASETIDVGTDSGNSDDPDGFIDGISLATAHYVPASLDSGSVTLGVLLQSTEDGGNVVTAGFRPTTSDDITITLSSGHDAAAGFVYLPYINTGET